MPKQRDTSSDRFYDQYQRDPEIVKFYQSAAWKKARKLALIRDNYLCQGCLSKKRFTSAEMVHHIVEVKDDINLRLELSNLESLCNGCHNKRHNRSEHRGKKITKKRNIKVVQTEKNPDIF
ncbi:HNH endonuclease signature motif containing protein [Lysinibacillus sp. UGB7]|uniref:HNH endonuclease signature motif containing protein n=1 Tax=Lysinibacillus sp. UGB7 TaxID=3411039 RepID=UPI003B80B0E4